METLNQIVKGRANLNCVKSGGVAEYTITSETGKKYILNIDLTDKVDCGDSASFLPSEKAIMFMRWIRRAMEKGELIEI